MFNDIGVKIKSLAVAIFAVEAVLAVISGIVLIASNQDKIFLGILVMVIGPVFAWVSSWLLYGFGELIDKVCEIELNTRGEDDEEDEKVF